MQPMSPAPNPWQRLTSALSAALFPRYWMAVIVDEPLRVTLNSDGREVSADGTARTIHSDDKLLASFDAVQAIDIFHHPRHATPDKPEHWFVSLYLGRSTRAYIGRSRKGAQCEKAAALLARLTGKPIRRLEVQGPNGYLPSR
jgi:hypothetical protein